MCLGKSQFLIICQYVPDFPEGLHEGASPQPNGKIMIPSAPLVLIEFQSQYLAQILPASINVHISPQQ